MGCDIYAIALISPGQSEGPREETKRQFDERLGALVNVSSVIFGFSYLELRN